MTIESNRDDHMRRARFELDLAYLAAGVAIGGGAWAQRPLLCAARNPTSTKASAAASPRTPRTTATRIDEAAGRAGTSAIAPAGRRRVVMCIVVSIGTASKPPRLARVCRNSEQIKSA